MRDTKLHEFLRHFSASERLLFRKFLRSPYFNQREDVVALFEFWEQYVAKSAPKMEDAQVWSALKTGKPFKSNEFHLVCSRLLALAKTFLTYEELGTEVHWQPIRLLRSYRKRHLAKPYAQLLETMKTEEGAQPLRDKDHLFRRYRRELERYEDLAARPRNPEVNLQSVSDHFQKFTIAECLREACLMLAHQAVFKKTYDFGMLPFMLDFLEQHPSWLEEPAILAYYLCYKAATASDNALYFQQLREVFADYRNAFPEDEIRAIYRHVLNLCIRRLNEGESRYQVELLRLYRTGLEQEILLEYGQLPAATFKNIVSVALKTGEQDWTEAFVERYLPLVQPGQREEMRLYNLGKLRFAQRRFGEAMPLLARLHSDDPLVMLDAKVLQAKMLYETKETLVLQDFLNTFRAFLRRQTISEGHVAYFTQIIQLFGKLLALVPHDAEKQEALRQAVLELRIESDKVWFLRQVEQ